jgi:hypothetical protein
MSAAVPDISAFYVDLGDSERLCHLGGEMYSAPSADRRAAGMASLHGHLIIHTSTSNSGRTPGFVNRNWPQTWGGSGNALGVLCRAVLADVTERRVETESRNILRVLDPCDNENQF